MRLKNNIDQIQSGTNKAILTLSDGSEIVLNDSTHELIVDGRISINKEQGILNYNTATTSETAVMRYNTMKTPRGGQYQLILPDGSKVWLNSASSLKYPVLFNENTRTVELTGEGYFEIKENKSKPFIVKTKKVDIAVLGTAFNINAYEDEPELATTLVNGAIKVKTLRDSILVKPGEQASFIYGDKKLRMAIPKMENVLALETGKI